MELLVAIGSLSLVAGIAGIASILVSRKGDTPSHRWACVAGIASLSPCFSSAWAASWRSSFLHRSHHQQASH